MAPFAFHACQATALGKEYIDAACHRTVFSYTSVKLDASRLKVGDEAGLGAINTPYASLGVVKTDKGLNLRCYDQNTNKEVLKPLAKK